ncbi:MAG: carboxypeptidase M32 [Halodesulfurarchaeum sp.]
MTDPIETLRDRYGKYVALGDANELLAWDQQTKMPAGGTPARSKQRATLSALEHDLLTGEELSGALADASAADLDPEAEAIVREIRRVHERQAAVPRELVEARAAASAEALEDWEAAREAEDFSQFAPALERQVELAREYAAAIDPDRDPYAVLFEEYEPYLGLETAERVLTRLKEALVPRIEAIAAADVAFPDPFPEPVDPDTQRALARDALDLLGYDWDRGRLDTAAHPFSTGTQFDARVTTRFHEENPLSALLSTIHEFGHARYTLGLPQAAYGSPLGQNRGLTVHESQSRLWENHVGRSRAFWDQFVERVADRVSGIEPDDAERLYGAVNRVDPHSLIRVEADELTYHLHVVLRFEIERDLLSGDLDVASIPAVWNEKMESLLGVRPETPAEGALQDVHWSHGDFGYFPTYTLGSVLAAQLFEAARAAIPDLEERLAAGDPAPLATWLEEAVHRYGRRYRTGELVERATGRPLTADPFLDYVAEKYDALYDL